ncbi:RNA helicase [Citrus sinensis]|nr:RNA helicase [Citrus sinensis]
MGKKKQKKAEQQQQKQQQQQSPTVAEATRIRISQILDGFLASKDEVYTFDANLSNRERAVVHEVCKKMGMTSKSSGRGKQRRVSVYKSKKRVETDKGKENLPSLTFSEGSKLVLQDLFTHYPPDDGEPGEKLDANQSRKSDKTRGKRDDIFCKPKMSKAEIAMKVESLTSRIEKDANLRQIVEERSKLPISSFKDVITSTVDSNQVVLISGETGCGKTTQIRLESKGGKHSSIVFCTNGVLLRLLVSQGVSRLKEASNKPAKDDVSALTHIIVDEIHERDRYSDFMLAIIRDMLPSYPHLRLVKSFYLEDVLSILKSAESNHLDSASLIVPNEDPELTEENKSTLDEAISLAWSNDEFDMLLELVSLEGSPNVYNYQHTLTGLTPLMVLAGKGRVGDVCMLLSLGADCQLKAKDGRTALQLGEQENQPEVAQIIKKHMENALSDSMKQQLLDKYLATVNPELIDLVLIEQLLRKICMDSEDGAILVFLPGWEDINKTRDRLLANPFFRDTSKFVIIPLHSMVPSVQQKKVFKRPPPGCRKIILSTNIAETAITIDDVVYVIDSGRMKEKSYDPYNNVSTLQSSWVSKASAKQRAGRAGRCQAGICYHLYSQLRAASLPDFQVPEIKRIPIEELCLQVKLLDPNCNIEDFLQKTLDPPVSVTIRNAIIVLQDIGALSLDEKVTELGEKLGCLSVHPLMSKMLFFAILMDCLDPALTLACASDYRDPFTLPISPNEKKRATAAKFELASLYGGQSDQLAVIAAFECWKNAKQRGQEAWFCSQYFVSSGVMNMLLGMRKQLQTELIKNGFIPEDVSSCSHNARVPGIIHAVLMAGLYPMVARLRPPHKNGRRFVETAGGAKVRLHPHSLNFKLSFKKTDDCPLMVYDEITRGDGGMHVRNCTVVGPLPLLLLATEIAVAPAPDNEDDDEDDDMSDDDADENESDEDCMEIDDKTSVQHGENVMSSPDKSVTVVVDRWLYFGSTALDIAQIYCLRERLSAAILFKVTHPQKALPPVLEASMYAMASILSYDGFSGISLPAESVESLTSMIQATEIDKCPAARNRGTGQNPSNFLMSLMSPNTRQYFPLRDHKSRIPAHKGSTKGNQLSTQVAQPPLFHGSPVVGSGSVKVYNALFQYGKTPDFGLS